MNSLHPEVHTAKLISTSSLADDRLIELFENSRGHNPNDELELMESEFVTTYCARVSNPGNQDNVKTAPKLLRYLMKHRHWSPFEMANMVVEIDTTRAIAAQVLRHRSFSYQEFSQRYSDVSQLPRIGLPHLRTQDLKNKQASHDNLDEDLREMLELHIERHYAASQDLYNQLLAANVAKECARSVLPLGTPTRLLMNGTLRSWIHYIQIRSGVETQLEHRLVAEAIQGIFAEQFPTIHEAAFT